MCACLSFCLHPFSFFLFLFSYFSSFVLILFFFRFSSLFNIVTQRHNYVYKYIYIYLSPLFDRVTSNLPTLKVIRVKKGKGIHPRNGLKKRVEVVKCNLLSHSFFYLHSLIKNSSLTITQSHAKNELENQNQDEAFITTLQYAEWKKFVLSSFSSSSYSSVLSSSHTHFNSDPKVRSKCFTNSIATLNHPSYLKCLMNFFFFHCHFSLDLLSFSLFFLTHTLFSSIHRSNIFYPLSPAQKCKSSDAKDFSQIKEKKKYVKSIDEPS